MVTYRVVLDLTFEEDEDFIDPKYWDWTTLLDMRSQENVSLVSVTEVED